MSVSFRNAVILITGASSGIGAALASELARPAPAGHAPQTLILVARRTDRLQELKQTLATLNPALTVAVYACDLTDRPATDAFLATALQAHGRVDILINNAGFGVGGLYDKAPWESIEAMLQLNIVSLAYLTRRLLPAMVERGSGGILNVSSGYGVVFGPGMAGYIGTKHFVTGFSEGLRLDLTGTGVSVTQLLPGPVDTEFSEALAKVSPGDQRLKLPPWLTISAEHCARVALKGLRRGRARVIPGFWMNVILRTARCLPLFVIRLVLQSKAQAYRRHTPTVQPPLAPE